MTRVTLHPRVLGLGFALSCLPAMAHPGHTGEPSNADEPVPILDIESQVTITQRDGYRIIEANGIPDHEPGTFPNRGNPNRITAQSYSYRMPLEPEANDEPRPSRGVFGIALNGVPFDPGTAEFWSPDSNRPTRERNDWNYEALSGAINLGVDRSNAHVQPTGAYHYHGIPTSLVQARQQRGQPTLIGYAADGFPIYGPMGYDDPMDPDSRLRELTPSYELKQGRRPTGDDGPGGRYDGTFTNDFEYVQGSGDLDACNGRFGVTTEYPDGTYYYVLTDAFPHIPRLLRGTPDASFTRGPERGTGGEDRPGGMRDPGRPGGPPPPGMPGPPPGRRPR